jgi:hypothetical protein
MLLSRYLESEGMNIRWQEMGRSAEKVRRNYLIWSCWM